MRTALYLFLAAGAVAGLFVVTHAAEVADLDRAKRLQADGNYREALDLARPLASDPDTPPAAAAGAVDVAVRSAGQLNAWAELDKLLVAAAEAHPRDAEVIQRVARALQQMPNYGQVVAGKFERGSHQGGLWVQTPELDRRRALRLLASLLDDADGDAALSSEFYLMLADTLLWNRQHRHGWMLQQLTDLDEPVEYDRSQPVPDTSFAPVDADGQPVVYTVPDSWADAAGDGERWRWALAQAAEAGPDAEAKATQRRADFLRGQFGVRTLQSRPWWGRGGDDEETEQVRQRMIRQLRDLSDGETIAQLATGIRRFELPEEHNYIALYRQLAEGEAAPAVAACHALAEIYEDRRQLPTAAQWWQTTIDKAPEARRGPRERLKQIVEPLAEFLSQPTSPAGEGAELVMRYRNATEVKMTARRIDLDRLLADVRDQLREGERGDRRVWQIDQLARALLNEDRDRYTAGRVASWNVALEPAEDHLDRIEHIATPLSSAGAYWVEADVTDGNKCATVVWVADTTIVHKRTADGPMYFVADARTGQPVAGAELTFFGFRRQSGNRRWRVHETRMTTDGDGLAVADRGQQKQGYHYITVARTGRRMAVLGLRMAQPVHRGSLPATRMTLFGATSQPAYRPDQKIEFKLWARRVGYEIDDEVPSSGDVPVQVEVYDPRGTRVYSEQLKTDPYGGVEGSLRLPAGSTLGAYNVQAIARVDGQEHYGNVPFRVEEYKKPEFEVTVDAPERPVALGETVTAKVRAAYYFGAPVTDAEVRVKVERQPHATRWYPPTPWDWLYGEGYWWFTPTPTWYPGYERWIGCFPPWWPYRYGEPELVAEISGRIGADGTIDVPIETGVAKELFGDESQQYTITAEVRDASRRTVEGSGKVLVSAEPFEIFSWTHRGHYRVGDVVTAEFRAATIDGRPVSGSGRLDLLRLSYEGDDVRETEVGSWEVDADDQGRATQRFRAAQAGQYRLRYRVTSDEGAEAEGGELLTVLGPGVDARDFRFTSLEIVPDARDYTPGDTAELQIRTDRIDSFVLLFRRPEHGAYPRPEVLRIDGKVSVQELAIEQRDRPNVFVEALTVSDGEVHAEARQLAVPPEKRVLDVEVETPEEEYEPGTEVPLAVRVTGPDGRPFVGQALVRVYDRALDAIAGEIGPGDIREAFWGWKRNHHAHTDHTLSRVEPNVYPHGVTPLRPIGAFGNAPGAMMGGMGGMGMGGGRQMQLSRAAPMAETAARAEAEPADAYAMADDAAAGADQAEAPTLRTDFADSILWVAAVETDAEGRAELTLPLPDNLTAWKIQSWIMGPAAEVGAASGEVRVRKPLMIRPQSPRFAVEGDRLTLSGVVHNDTGRDAEVRVRLELDDEVLEPLGDLEQTVRVPDGQSARVDWPVRATAEGEATMRMIARAGEAGDAVEVTMPCKVHGMLRTEAWAGTIRGDAEDAELEITVPAERRPEQTVLEIRYSPTLAAAMLDALPYLVEFPYGCTEQVLNRFLPAVITRQTLQRMDLDLEALGEQRANLNAQERGDPDERRRQWQRWKSPVFDEERLTAVVSEGVRRLAEMQNDDGGWGWFSGAGEQSGGHTTAVVVRGLVVARDADVPLPEGMLEQGLEWLDRYRAEQLRRMQLDPDEAEFKSAADNLDALVHHILVEAQRPDEAMGDRLYEDRLKLSLYGKTLLALALLESDDERWALVRRNVEQFLGQDAENETAWLEDRTPVWWYWYTDTIEANAMYLKLLSRVEPEGVVAPRLVKWLLNNRKHATYWRSTRDTALCVEAMADYLEASGEARPEMTVEVWLDDEQVGEQEITPENLFTLDNVVSITGADLTDGDHTVRLVRRGEGNLYFNVYLTNFTLVDPIPAAGLEIKVARKYWRLVRDDQALQQAGKRGGAVAGDRESYRREPLTDGDRLEVGELVEVELVVESKNDYEYIMLEDFKAAGLEPVAVRSGYLGGFGGLGAYQELRDDRVALFVQRMPQGTHGLRYRLRAEVPGRFSALPTTAEGMYAPELAANSDEAKIEVTD